MLNADPSDPNFKVPDLLPPDYLARCEPIGDDIGGRLSTNRSRSLNRRQMPALDSNLPGLRAHVFVERLAKPLNWREKRQGPRGQYGRNRFGQSCLLARRLIEAGVRYVTVNMFETVFDEITWDIHGSRPFSPISCYRDLVGPMFDNAFSSLLEDLSQRGLLDNTLVIATGEFGRTPKVNPAGGRDHWPACWSCVFAGGGVQGGKVVGASDDIGGAPKDRPVTPPEFAATVYQLMGLDLETFLPAQQGRIVPFVDDNAQPVKELLA